MDPQAVHEVLEVNSAPTPPPEWQPFHTADSCSCCSAKFTWHCTTQQATTVYREKHNCRQCGLLVCDPCSKHSKVLPRLGLLQPCRVCDRCFYEGTKMPPKDDAVVA